MSILDTIDGALADYAASGDAMRWVPDDKRTEENRPGLPLLGGRSVNMTVTIDTGEFMAALAEDCRRALEAFRPAVEAQAKACAQFTHSIDRAFFPELHRRCVTCHPWRKPKPLAVNGREYQRRLRARRRRNH